MEKEQQEEIKELEEVSAHLGEVKECRICKYVLLLSFAALLLIMTAVFFEGEKIGGLFKPSSSPEPFHSIPPTKEDIASTTAEFNQRVLELGQTAFGTEGGSVDTGSGVSVSGSSASGTQVIEPKRRPDGPPPLLPPNVN